MDQLVIFNLVVPELPTWNFQHQDAGANGYHPGPRPCKIFPVLLIRYRETMKEFPVKNALLYPVQVEIMPFFVKFGKIWAII